MATDTDAPVDLYVAAYLDADAARADWDVISSSPPTTRSRSRVWSWSFFRIRSGGSASRHWAMRCSPLLPIASEACRWDRRRSDTVYSGTRSSGIACSRGPRTRGRPDIWAIARAPDLLMTKASGGGDGLAQPLDPVLHGCR